MALLEREREVEALRDAIHSAAEGGGAVVLVEGAPGIGKSVLLEKAGEAAQGAGLGVLAARSGELEGELPWSVVRDLLVPALERATPERREQLLEGAAGLAEPLLRRTSAGAGAGSDALAGYLHGVYWLVANLAEQDPVALLVDDAHWADPLSLRALAYVARRAGDLRLALIVASRPPVGKTGGMLRALGSGARLVQPGPLSEAGSHGLLDAVLGAAASAQFARSCHTATGGNPFLLSELALELRRGGVAPGDEAVHAVDAATPETVSRAVLLRLSALGQDARDLAGAAAVLGMEADLAVAAKIAGLDPDLAAAAAAELARADVLAADLPLRFVHPLVRSVIYEDVVPARQSLAHARAADALLAAGAEAPSIAVHLHATEPGAVSSAAKVLSEAAADALARGAPAAAAADLRRALDEPLEPEPRAAILIELADAEAAAGEHTALGRLEQALPLLADVHDRALVFKRLGSLLYGAGQFEKAGEAFARGLDVLGETDTELANELRGAGLTISALVDSDVDSADSALQALGGPPDRDPKQLSAAEREVLTQLSLARIFRAQGHEEARELARRALGDGAMLAEQGVSLSFSVAVSCLTWSDDFQQASREIERALEHARARGALLDAAYVLFGRSQVGYWCGRLSEAAADAGAAVQAWDEAEALHIVAAKCWRAMCLVELDELEAASAVLEASEPGARPLVAMEEATLAIGRGRVALAGGDFAAVLTAAGPLIRAGGERPPFFHTPAYLPWRSDAAVAAAGLGRREQAVELAEEELALARSFGAPRPLGVALRAAGLAAGGEPGAELLRQSVDVLQPSPARVELCRTLVELGASLRRAGGRSEARDHLSAAAVLAQRHGAKALERRAGEELAASGARVPKRELSGPESLTPSERRVAELAAAGTANRAIAQQLFVSLRTVETHLTHAYQKLEIDSRRELAAALTQASP